MAVNDLVATGKRFECTAEDGSRHFVYEMQKVFDERTARGSAFKGASAYFLESDGSAVISLSLNDVGLRRFKALEPIGVLTQVDPT